MLLLKGLFRKERRKDYLQDEDEKKEAKIITLSLQYSTVQK